MQPTITTSDILLCDCISPRIGKIAKGDIVVARAPITYQCVCKRVVAVSGDLVLFGPKVVMVPDGHVWLEGDNKSNSTDSRDYGPVPIENVRRRCFCKIWPYVDFAFGSAIPFYSEAAQVQPNSR